MEKLTFKQKLKSIKGITLAYTRRRYIPDKANISWKGYEVRQWLDYLRNSEKSNFPGAKWRKGRVYSDGVQIEGIVRILDFTLKKMASY